MKSLFPTLLLLLTSCSPLAPSSGEEGEDVLPSTPSLGEQRDSHPPSAPIPIEYGDWEEYHPNGKVKEKGRTDIRFGCGMAVDLSEFYDSTGMLLRTVKHEQWRMGDGGCHDIIQEQYITEYHPNGRVAAVKRFQNSYEGESSKCGQWEFYSSKGIKEREEVHPCPFENK